MFNRRNWLKKTMVLIPALSGAKLTREKIVGIDSAVKTPSSNLYDGAFTDKPIFYAPEKDLEKIHTYSPQPRNYVHLTRYQGKLHLVLYSFGRLSAGREYALKEIANVGQFLRCVSKQARREQNANT